MEVPNLQQQQQRPTGYTGQGSPTTGQAFTAPVQPGYPPALPSGQSGYSAAPLHQGQGHAAGAHPPTWSAGGTHETFPEKKITEATTIERQEREAIIRETIIPQERIEIQPVIHREREVLELHQVTQPVYEKEIRATRIEDTELPAEYREKIEGSQAEFQERLREGMEGMHSSVHWENVERKVIDQTPIIKETIKKIVREEVQPIIYREIVEPRVIRETLPIYERVVEAPRVFREQREPLFKDYPRESFRHLGHLDHVGSSGVHHQGSGQTGAGVHHQGSGAGASVGLGPASAGIHAEHSHTSGVQMERGKEQQQRSGEHVTQSEMKGR